MQSQPTKPKVIIVTGPTAVGKTKIGLELAKRLGGEVISADSVQVYKGLDIGSDKLPEAQRQGIPHHLIDVLPPTAEFTAGEFYKLGRQATEDILSRGKVPIIVGGTGFYLRFYMYGKPQTPQSSPELLQRAAELVQEAWRKAAKDQEAVQALAQQSELAAQLEIGICGDAARQDCPVGSQQQQQQQQQQDHKQQHQDDDDACPAGPAGDGAADGSAWPGGPEPPRVSRRKWRQQCREQRRDAREALPPSPEQLLDRNMPPDPPSGLSREQLWDAASSVIELLGDPEAAARVRAERHNWYRLMRVCQILLQTDGKKLKELDVDKQREPDYDFRCFFLHRPRRQLYDKIALRVEEMVASGLLREAKELLDMGVRAGSCPAARAIGYRQALEFLQEVQQQQQQPRSDDGSTRQQLLQMIMDIGTATRKLVKSQHTWFRDDAIFKWVDNTAPEEEVVQGILGDIERQEHQGGCEDSGRLDKQEAKLMREYVQPIVVLKDQQLVERVLGEVRSMMGCSGEGSGCIGNFSAGGSSLPTNAHNGAGK